MLGIPDVVQGESLSLGPSLFSDSIWAETGDGRKIFVWHKVNSTFQDSQKLETFELSVGYRQDEVRCRLDSDSGVLNDDAACPVQALPSFAKRLRKPDYEDFNSVDIVASRSI